MRAAAAAQVLVADPADPALSDADRHHLGRVLRLRSGEAVVATDGRGRWRSCRYGEGVLTPDGPVEAEDAPQPPLTVAFAPVKGDRPEWVVQKLTELGIDRIVPLATDRSVVRWRGDRRDHVLERLRRVVVEATAQCRRVWLPDVTDVEVLEPLAALGGLALAQPGGPPLCPGTTAVAVGPEGGWSPGELALGLPTVGLGPTVLRAETATLAAGVLLVSRRAGTVCSGDHGG
ncbi:MAG: 16S rRNA (uracil(1498)-N(3))-methyltransferase [Acidimicrobiales bacterium]